jgi:hypothetical protein
LPKEQWLLRQGERDQHGEPAAARVSEHADGGDGERGRQAACQICALQR